MNDHKIEINQVLQILGMKELEIQILRERIAALEYALKEKKVE